MLDSLLASPPPTASAQEAERLAQQHFGLKGHASRLTSERDLNFRIVIPDGRAFVLKIANAQEDPLILDYQLAALRHVAAKDAAMAVPRVVPALDGGTVATIETAGGTAHFACVLSFIEGVPLAAGAPSDEHPAALGSLLARLDRALADFDHPAADRALLWDMSRAATLESLLPHVVDPWLHDLAAATLAAFVADALPVLPSLRRQVIHNDLNPHNVIAKPTGEIVGVIDFGDMVRAPLVNDLAVAASYRVGRGDAPLGQAGAMIAAYHAVNPLHPEERALLPLLIATRTAVSVAITAWRTTLYPENRDYILRNLASTAATLARLDADGRAAATAQLRQMLG